MYYSALSPLEPRCILKDFERGEAWKDPLRLTWNFHVSLRADNLFSSLFFFYDFYSLTPKSANYQNSRKIPNSCLKYWKTSGTTQKYYNKGWIWMVTCMYHRMSFRTTLICLQNWVKWLKRLIWGSFLIRSPNWRQWLRGLHRDCNSISQ